MRLFLGVLAGQLQRRHTQHTEPTATQHRPTATPQRQAIIITNAAGDRRHRRTALVARQRPRRRPMAGPSVIRRHSSRWHPSRWCRGHHSSDNPPWASAAGGVVRQPC